MDYLDSELEARWGKMSWLSPSLQPKRSRDFKLWNVLISSIFSCKSGNLQSTGWGGVGGVGRVNISELETHTQTGRALLVTCFADTVIRAPSHHMHRWTTARLSRTCPRSETHDSPQPQRKVCPLFARGSPPESPRAECCPRRTAAWCRRGISCCISNFPLRCR